MIAPLGARFTSTHSRRTRAILGAVSARSLGMIAPDGAAVVSTSGELSPRFLAEVRRPVTTYGVETGRVAGEGLSRSAERSRFKALMRGLA